MLNRNNQVAMAKNLLLDYSCRNCFKLTLPVWRRAEYSWCKKRRSKPKKLICNKWEKAFVMKTSCYDCKHFDKSKFWCPIQEKVKPLPTRDTCVFGEK